VIFFDEFDALCPKRSDSGDGNSTQRVVNQLLTEMDGVQERKGVFLMAASNRPDIIDPAILRPGRLDKIIYVGLPATNDRIDILQALTKNGTKPELADDVDLSEIAGMSERFTGADLAGLVREASYKIVAKAFDASEGELADLKAHKKDFTDALSKMKPSVSEQVRKYLIFTKHKN
jgi:ribosome biogenesis ATPase